MCHTTLLYNQAMGKSYHSCERVHISRCKDQGKDNAKSKKHTMERTRIPGYKAMQPSQINIYFYNGKPIPYSLPVSAYIYVCG